MERVERTHRRPGPYRARLVVTQALHDFVAREASGGIAILAAAVLALVVANSGLGEVYERLWHTYVGVSVGAAELRLSLLHWINDGLMAVFFFLVGLEIKREILVGELSTPRRAALPAIAALGGALLPAAIYAGFNAGGPWADGWGIPMATDIAFAVGVLALLGSRAPLWLKAFVTALAIADDILAVLVIAVFYTAELDTEALGWAAGVLALLAVIHRSGARSGWAYVLPSLVLWYLVMRSGVHATIAGVTAAAFVPASLRSESPERTRSGIRSALSRFARALTPLDRSEEGIEAKDLREDVLRDLAKEVAASEAPLYRLEHALHPYVAFGILPVFAFANAGVAVPLDTLAAAVAHPLPLGIALGLLLGKPAGIAGLAWLAVRLRIADLPEGAEWSTLAGGGLLAGIGFTMSIFIASLAFADPEALDLAKIGILGGSLVAGAAGFSVLWASGGRASAAGAPAGPEDAAGG